MSLTVMYIDKGFVALSITRGGGGGRDSKTISWIVTSIILAKKNNKVPLIFS